jgi:hypothetical protein
LYPADNSIVNVGDLIDIEGEILCEVKQLVCDLMDGYKTRRIVINQVFSCEKSIRGRAISGRRPSRYLVTKGMQRCGAKAKQEER